VVPRPPTRERTRPPASIPDSAFLTARELGSIQLSPDTDVERLTDLCGTDVGAEDGARLHRRFSGDIESLVAVIQQEVALFDSTAEARRYLSGLRERVRACPSMPVDHGSGPDRSYRFRLLDAPDLGDDVVLIERRQPAYEYESGEVVPGRFATFYTAAVRHGDAVTVLDTGDWEAGSLEYREYFRPLLVRASERLVDWRGPTG
jgi:hypothetical protein